jgi:hypothetical protein
MNNLRHQVPGALSKFKKQVTKPEVLLTSAVFDTESDFNGYIHVFKDAQHKIQDSRHQTGRNLNFGRT